MAKWGNGNIIISKIYQRDQTNKTLEYIFI